MFDLLIRGATVVTGEIRTPFAADVAVINDKIAAIGADLPMHAKRVIDAGGLILCPGFIDFHAHSDITLLAEPLGESKLRQGVTTEINGNCGLTPFPLYDSVRRRSLSFIDVPGVDWNWRSTGEYLSRLEDADLAYNSVMLVGHGSIRAAVAGYENRLLTSQELEAMKKLLAECFEAGCWGISTGLGYAPDFYSDEDELCALAEVVKNYHRVFTFHIRGERKTLFKAVSEAINVSRRTGANVQISHLKCCDSVNFGRMKELLALIESAVAEGLPVHFDLYPYTAGSAYLGLVFPPWLHEGGMEQALRRLKDPEQRRQAFDEMRQGTDTWSSILAESAGANVLITNTASGNQELIGKTIAAVSAAWELSPAETAAKIMLAENGEVEMVMFQQQEADMEMAMAHPRSMIGSDGLAFDGGGRIDKGTPHPRSYGTFPRVFRRYVFDKNVLTLESAVHKMTFAVAQKLSLLRRGLVAPGYFADLVLFDPKAIRDRAEYNSPKQFPEGILMVAVNGRIALDTQGPTTERAGRVLRF